MGLIRFEQVPEQQQELGGKGFVLGRLKQLGFPIPAGAILTHPPSPDVMAEVMEWWREWNRPPLAVRSSAVCEDSSEHSHAGQNQTFLNIRQEEELAIAIERCFESIHGEASKTYRHFFAQENSQKATMNVVLQVMVNPKFSGVYFSRDPRGKAREWIIELIEGYGEDLVSGRKTPYFITAENRAGITVPGLDTFNFEKVLKLGERAKSVLGYEVDMEWALDQDLNVHMLQARPVTALRSISSQVKAVEAELLRLKKAYPNNPTWDGQTFAEWTGFPSYLTFSLWKNAFSPHHAFGKSLKSLGYKSFSEDKQYSPKDSLLERVFGRAYVNLDKMSDLYFGPIPYTMRAKPRPHLSFDFKKLNWKTVLATPVSLFNMLKVGINLSSKRSEWLKIASQKLVEFRSQGSGAMTPEVYQSWDAAKLRDTLCQESWRFAKEDLHWPLVLIVLTESTMQSILQLLASIMGRSEAEKVIRQWMAIGLHTVTSEMNAAFQEACQDPAKRPFFMVKYGHRGPGELDLAHPRWAELGESAFYSMTASVGLPGGVPGASPTPPAPNQVSDLDPVVAEVQKLKTFKRDILLQEWKLLKEMLELRERWKMELLKPYAQIRYMANALGERLGISSDIHWLRLSEIESIQNLSSEFFTESMKQRIGERKLRFKVFKQFSLPEFVTVSEMEAIISGEDSAERRQFDGQALSPGLVAGEVVVVENPTAVDPNSWKENTILVAEATDPGWTPLFAKVRGIVVDKGGVLSHCAILAREMNIPAVSQIRQCHRVLKNGDRIWVDGNNGRVTIESH